MHRHTSGNVLMFAISSVDSLSGESELTREICVNKPQVVQRRLLVYTNVHRTSDNDVSHVWPNVDSTDVSST